MNTKLISETKMSSVDTTLLRNKLDKFYGTATDYIPFSLPNNQLGCWEHIANEIYKIQKESPKSIIKVLETGAGKSGFGDWLKEINLRDKIEWTAQDVTVMNKSWLDGKADKTVYGDINLIAPLNNFDIVFSTYVLEHVTNPEQHLNYLHSLLTENGSLFIFCPRYDMPGYLCPSAKHLGTKNRMSLAVKALSSRLISIFTSKPAFLIQTDLAAFYRPFFLDADAVHWVSLIDLKLWAKGKGSIFGILKFGKPKFGSKDWVVKRLLTCAVVIRK